MTVETDKRSLLNASSILKPETVYQVEIASPGQVVLTELAPTQQTTRPRTREQLVAAIEQTALKPLLTWEELRRETREKTGEF